MNEAMRCSERDAKLLEQVRAVWQPTATRTGRLILRCDGYWHYGVALSDAFAISWGPVVQGLTGPGVLSLHALEPQFLDAHGLAGEG